MAKDHSKSVVNYVENSKDFTKIMLEIRSEFSYAVRY